MAQQQWTSPTPLYPNTQTIQLDSATGVANLRLNANIPSTIYLSGFPDLQFTNVSLSISATQLVRDMTQPVWGSCQCTVDAPTGITDTTRMTEFLLPRITRVEQVIVAIGHKESAARLDIKEGDHFRTLMTLPLVAEVGPPVTYTGNVGPIFQTDVVRIDKVGTDLTVQLLSPSYPTLIGMAIGGDTPSQTFLGTMSEGVVMQSGDMTDALNGAWASVSAAVTGDGPVKIAIHLTSLTDGLVTVQLDGSWGRYPLPVIYPLDMDGNQDTFSLTPTWPWPGDVKNANIIVSLFGTILGEGRLGLTGLPPAQSGATRFSVRVAESLQVAQLLDLKSMLNPCAACSLTAIWLNLSVLPTSEQWLQLQVATVTGQPAIPANPPLYSFNLPLPAQAEAYVLDGETYWYRAAFPQPFQLTDTQACQLLAVTATGLGSSTQLLTHYTQDTADYHALVRNFAGRNEWVAQNFHGETTSGWLVDLEVQPLKGFGEAPSLVATDVSVLQLSAVGVGTLAIQSPTLNITGPTDPTITLNVSPRLRGTVQAKVAIFRKVKL